MCYTALAGTWEQLGVAGWLLGTVLRDCWGSLGAVEITLGTLGLTLGALGRILGALGKHLASLGAHRNIHAFF